MTKTPDPNPLRIDDDYHLLPTSPCIDAESDANIYANIECNPYPLGFPDKGIDNYPFHLKKEY